MIVTVTGSRHGITPPQRAFLVDVLRQATMLHHGGSVGADREAHGLFHTPRQITIWPSNVEQLMWANKQKDATVHAMLPPLVRNRRMVDEGEIVYAFPKGFHEEFGNSGTWSAIRYARQTKRVCMIFWPDGTATVEA